MCWHMLKATRGKLSIFPLDQATSILVDAITDGQKRHDGVEIVYTHGCSLRVTYFSGEGSAAIVYPLETCATFVKNLMYYIDLLIAITQAVGGAGCTSYYLVASQCSTMSVLGCYMPSQFRYIGL